MDRSASAFVGLSRACLRRSGRGGAVEITEVKNACNPVYKDKWAAHIA
jgi:hypothetical protein